MALNNVGNKNNKNLRFNLDDLRRNTVALCGLFKVAVFGAAPS